jgi:hypothetical protein
MSHRTVINRNITSSWTGRQASSRSTSTFGVDQRLQISLKMVVAVGFEPTFRVFSSLLIVAFLCANLPPKLQAFPSYSKHYFASLSNYRQKNLCGNVRLCGNCAGRFIARWTVESHVLGQLSAIGAACGGFGHPAQVPSVSIRQPGYAGFAVHCVLSHSPSNRLPWPWWRVWAGHSIDSGQSGRDDGPSRPCAGCGAVADCSTW